MRYTPQLSKASREAARTEDPPLRSELFSIAQLERHAQTLAGAAHRIGKPGPDRLLPRLDDNERVLAAAYALVAEAVTRGRQITPAAEWFIDNYHLIEEQIRIARQHLPRGYSRELPRGADGTPRVYQLAIELISHSHGRVDLDALSAFVSSYQTVHPLLLGELWAIPIMLRLALIENLRRVITRVAAGRLDREHAGRWAEKLLDTAADHPTQRVVMLAALVDDDPPLTHAFVSELASRLQGHGAAAIFPLSWLEQRLAEQGLTIEHVFHLASQSQAADQVAIGNSIGSLRFLGATDWRDFVEGMSVLDDALRADPAGVYAAMDFATRDRYRHVVERISKREEVGELVVAQRAIALANEQSASRMRHVGYFLVDAGRRALERAVRGQKPARARAQRSRLPVYLGAIVGLTVLVTAALIMQASPVATPLFVGWSIAIAVGASQLAVSIVQWASTLLVAPRVMPRLDFTEGIPAEHRTIVAVPTMLTSIATIDELVDALEVRYLANRDPQLGFALLGDLRDAAAEHLDGDAALLQHATSAIEGLNEKYPDRARGGGFFLFHRARRWNAREGVWMGWERKRGKLEDFNAALRGETGRFATIVGPVDRIADTKYVIVLDSDTELPRDTARALAGTIGHPLNRAVFDEALGRVTEGYAILQPRVGISLASANSSRFARMFAGECGIDPYTRAVSDVYQDLFGEGSFIGKGIYDIDAVRQATHGRFPENRVLSHDLLEGAYGRAGLVSDLMLIEDYPTAYAADASRRARWIRGDWQIARWLMRRVPGGGARRIRNPISWLSQWKIGDNLRRSLVPPALLALITIACWAPALAPATVLLVGSMLLLPGLLSAASSLVRRPKQVSIAYHLGEVATQLGQHVSREAFSLATLPFDAWVSVTEIVRATTRTMVTHKKLLEWKTAADANRAKRTSVAGSYASMWIVPAVGAAIAIMLALHHAETLWVAGPVLGLWLLAPALVWSIGHPVDERRADLGASDRRFLRTIARRTWRFFETYVGPESNHLAPDNVQEDPPVGIAHRTSPTNIGLQVLSSLAAYDFGYISIAEVAARTTQTFATLDRMQRHHGHFYNWYDTRTLEPLRPRYVSTVDSGNLAGSLMTLASGLTALADEGVFRAQVFAGLADTLDIVEEHGDVAPVRALLAPAPATLRQAHDVLTRVIAAAEPLEGEWAAVLADQCRRAHAALVHLAPWLALAADPELAERIPTLTELARLEPSGDAELRAAITLGATRAAELIGELRALAVRCGELADYDYEMLYDRGRDLLSIGFNVVDHRLDASFYDLLASEARLASYVAIAQGKLPQAHWFRLGRLLTTSRGRPTLLSWSGSMFEYLMPLLVMPTYDGTLLDVTYQVSVARQIEYGREHGVPWGVSESGYNKVDAHLNYQYRAFGVPGLGFKRGLADDLVIAPYACVMAVMVAPAAAAANLRRLRAEDQLGGYGFYEAIDYTASRMPPGKHSVTVRSYMAHHQGMSLLALTYALLDRPMQRRFSADPALRATDLLLQERVQRTSTVFPHPAEVTAVRTNANDGETELRVVATPHTPAPELRLLSNGNYHVAVSNAGGGYSRLRELSVTRWQEDATRDCWGQFCYLRDVTTGSFWSATHQPTLRAASSYEAIFSPGRVEFRRRDEDIDTYVEISVSPEDDIELRRITLSNFGKTKRTIEITSYAEVVLATAAADAAHRAFSNLFVQTELITDKNAILCTRRPRSSDEKPPWLVHLMTVHGPTAAATSFETSRAAFIGRGQSTVDPAAMHRDALSNSSGSVLDPIVAIRSTIDLAPDETVQLHLVTGVVETRVAAIGVIDKYRDRHAAQRIFELAWTQSHVVHRRLEITSSEALLWERLAGSIIYLNPAMRAPASVLASNRRGQSALWAYGISGDLPILLVRIASSENLDLVRQLVRAHAYFRLKGLIVDLVIWNEDPSGYRQNLHEQIVAAVASHGDPALVDRPGGTFLRRSDQMTGEDCVLMQAIARVIFDDSAGTFAEQMERRTRPTNTPALDVSREDKPPEPAAIAPIDRPDLTAFNGHGGFTHDGKEYVITTHHASHTPAPWVNVLANPYFGTVISESGAAYTWCENAHSYRLTPWSNDPICDPSGEAFYLRDEDDGRFWSPTPSPATGSQPYATRHGFGYTVFETTEDGVSSSLRTFVATDAPIKFVVIALDNRSGRPRNLSLTGFFELVLGSQRTANLPHVMTEVDIKTGALFASNPYSGEFVSRVAFLQCSEDQRFVTGDRLEFIGRNGTLARPAVMTRARLSGRVGPGLDPCLAMQVSIELAANEAREIVFVFGSGRDLADARHLVTRFRGTGAAQAALETVWAYWNRTLGAVNVQTPDAALNFLANGWLLYQVLACRMWGRSGFYQSGGAFGFRDQLQDATALLHAEPALLREQLLRAAAHQFAQGDVQHWWHPPLGRGVRTRISDDFLWLPYAVSRYVTAIGDTGVLDESIEFLEGRVVNADEESYYDLPTRSIERASLYEHCVRAITNATTKLGVHGLPLMGTGDWNDGMNLVGHAGRGESVWLAFFLHDVLVKFADLARTRADHAFAEACGARAAELRTNIEAHAWDGAWYRRAYFDDGAPLGSSTSPECQIDSLPQSWAILSQAGDPERARQGLAAIDARLVDRELGVIKLFDPPFDRSELEPGYVKGYVPGVRENGGQYTHAAVWTVMAYAAAGDTERAWELFRMINPVTHGGDRDAIATYMVEPYVVAADVYTNPQHAGRGGWTWYTGSAGWMYRLIIESLLGIRLEVDRLRVEPQLPREWAGFEIHYRYRDTVHHIRVTNAGGGQQVLRVRCDGVDQDDRRIPLSSDGREHWAEIEIGAAS